MQVIPGDIESILMKHPAVVEAAVIGIPDEVAGERPLAFVVRSAFSDEELRDSIDDLVENSLHETHWLNGRIEFVPEIPKSQNGKVLKKVLRAMVGIH
jgi:acyl-coenzyme A synthetase/AMP-(fatty) acid ligase